MDKRLCDITTKYEEQLHINEELHNEIKVLKSQIKKKNLNEQYSLDNNVVKRGLPKKSQNERYQWSRKNYVMHFKSKFHETLCFHNKDDKQFLAAKKKIA